MQHAANATINISLFPFSPPQGLCVLKLICTYPHLYQVSGPPGWESTHRVQWLLTLPLISGAKCMRYRCYFRILGVDVAHVNLAAKPLSSNACIYQDISRTEDRPIRKFCLGDGEIHSRSPPLFKYHSRPVSSAQY